MTSLTVLLVVLVLLPQFLAQLRIRLLHRRFAQLTRDDVVVAAVGDVGWIHRAAAAASQRAAGASSAAGLRTLISASRTAASILTGALFAAVTATGSAAFAVLATLAVL